MYNELNILRAIVKAIEGHGLHGAYTEIPQLEAWRAHCIPTNFIGDASDKTHCINNTDPAEYNDLVRELHNSCSGQTLNLIAWIIFQAIKANDSWGTPEEIEKDRVAGRNQRFDPYDETTHWGACVLAFKKYFGSEIACIGRGEICWQPEEEPTVAVE